MKTIVLTAHAKAVIHERGLAFAWVERAVRVPQWIERDPSSIEVRRCFRAIPEYGNRYLRVAVVETATEFRIISVFFDRGARPK